MASSSLHAKLYIVASSMTNADMGAILCIMYSNGVVSSHLVRIILQNINNASIRFTSIILFLLDVIDYCPESIAALIMAYMNIMHGIV